MNVYEHTKGVFNRGELNTMEETIIIAALSAAFKEANVKEQVLQPDWYCLNMNSGIDATGFCYSASQVIYSLTGKSACWTMVRLADQPQWKYGTHYFLRRKKDNQVMDITSDQYSSQGIEVPYELGKGIGMMNVSGKARLLARLAGLGEL